MGTTALRSGPCPHCSGELEWKATVGNPEKGAETHFFQCKGCDHIHTVEKKYESLRRSTLDF